MEENYKKGRGKRQDDKKPRIMNKNSLKNLTRPKGTKHKFTKGMKATILEVWEYLQTNPEKEKPTALINLACNDPKWFYDLIRGMLPKDIFVTADVKYNQMTPEELDNEIKRLFAIAEGSED